VERLENLIAGLAALNDEEDDRTGAELCAEAEASGIDFAAWAARIRAMIAAHTPTSPRA
jgi:hypothetical protein